MTVEEALATVEAILGKESLNDLQEIIFRCCWEQKSYAEIAESYGYDADYIKYVGFQLWKRLSEAFGEKITKSNFRAALRRKTQFFPINNELADPKHMNNGSQITVVNNRLSTDILNFNANTQSIRTIQNRIDWGEAIDVSVFYGREGELATLKQWIQERCKLIAILGIGGTGKTALSVKLAEQVQEEFEYIVWRSLHNAPTIDSLLTNLINSLSNQQETSLNEDISSKVLQLLDYLQKHRCLIILDNVETILSSADTSVTLSIPQAGHYREGYEEYGELFKRIGEIRHSSCLVLTSREKPKEVAALEGQTYPIRSLQLFGLATPDGKEIFKAKGNFIGSANDWQTLIQSYAGNPLALKIVATTISDLFAGDIARFLAQGTVIFGDIQDLLNQQFNRLSSLEKEIMYWLAIDREPVAIAELQADLLSPILPARLIEALESLERRSLIEISRDAIHVTFTLQPVLMEYVTHELIARVCQEIEDKSIYIYQNHALIKAQTKDYIQDIQIQLILKPIINQLLRVFGNSDAIEHQLMQILSPLRGKLPIETGYAAGNTLNLLIQLQSDLSNLDLSHLTIWQADLRGTNLQGVDFSYSDLSKSTFTENIGYIFAMTVSINGILATADSYSKIRLWRVADGQQLLNWDAHKGWVRSLTFSPDGKILTSGSDDRVIKLWDVSTGQCRQTLQGHAGWILYVAFSPQGDILASGGEDATVKLWDISTGQCRQTLQGHTNWVCYVAYSPQGNILASGSVDSSIKLWEIDTGQCLKTLRGHEDKVGFLTFTADGQTLISASEDQTIKLWNVQTGECERTLPGGQNDWIWWCAVALSCDNKIAIGSRDSSIKLWDINTSQLVKTLQSSSGIRTIVFSPDGKTLIASHEDQTLKLWDVSDGRCLRTFQGYSSGIWAIAFSPDRQTLVSGGADQMVKLWNIPNNKCLRIFRGHTDLVRSVAYSPQGNTIASSSADKTIKLWDISDGRCIRTFQGHTNWVMSVTYSPDCQTLASASLDQTVRLWNIKTGKCLRVLHTHNTLALSVIYSPDGYTLASSGADHLVRLWDINTGECLRVLQGHTNWVWRTAFSPDGRTLASSSADYTVRVWDVKTGQCLRILSGHTSWVAAIAFSPQDEILASSSLDGTVRLWNVRDGRCLKVLQGHTRWVLAVTFTTGESFPYNRGQVLASSSDDQTIRFWDINTGECIKILTTERPYEGMNIAGSVGLTPAQKATLKALGAIEEDKETRETWGQGECC